MTIPTIARRVPRLLAGLLFVIALSVLASATFAQSTSPPRMEVPPSALTELTEVDNDPDRRGVVRTATIRLPADLFKEPPPPDGPRTVIRIPTGEDSFVELVETRRVVRGELTVIYGRDITQEHARFMFVRDGESIQRGEIERDDELITLSGARTVNTDVDFRMVVWRPSAFPDERAPNEAIAPSRQDESNGPAQDQAPEAGQVEASEDSDDLIEIDVLVIYTATAAAEADAEMDQAIEVTITNIVFDASGRMEYQAGVKLNLVGVEQVSYVEAGDMAVDLERLECPCDHKKKGVGNNHLNEVFDLWKSSGADVVSLWIRDGPETGFGNVMGTVGTDWAPRAVHVVTWDAAVTKRSFDHELGHQFGARHNWEKDNTLMKPYLYNHGYLNLSANQVTIMAYPTMCLYYGTSCTRAGIWSDPDYPLGGPWGVAYPALLPADNAQTLESSAPTVAAFNTRHDLVGCCIKEGGFFSRTYRPGQCP